MSRDFQWWRMQNKNDQSVLLPVFAQSNPELHMVIRVWLLKLSTWGDRRALPDPRHMIRERESDIIYCPVAPLHLSVSPFASTVVQSSYTHAYLHDQSF